MALNRIEEIIDDIRQGKMVIIMDDEDRENEGDLVMAASSCRPEDINFMATHGRGLICLTLTRERCRQLDLPLMVSQTNDAHGTNFTVSIEAAEGVTTGISAYDRAHTVRTAVRPDAKPGDIVQPGHIFPLMAQPGGVLTRAGHTEAGCDLTRLAGSEPAAVIVEILNEDGTMARRPDLERFAETHGLKIGTIADLIRYRIENEKTIERVETCEWESEFGPFTLHAYRDVIRGDLHFAMVRGSVGPSEPALVRVHVENTLCDLFAPAPSLPCGWPLRDALKRVADEGTGVVVVLQYPESGDDLVARMRQCKTKVEGQRNPPRKESDDELRTLGAGAQILADLGVREMRVLGAPRVMHGLAGFGLSVADYVDH
ncbi:MAG: bifunctional 3,4-dihydroxy-2-butanone-4-phosphate synthase/GTP cyclohydrolase II [Gammaproteobacteria bacterium]